MPGIDDSATGGGDHEEHESLDSEWSGASPSPENLQICEEDSLHVRGSDIPLGKTRSVGDFRFDIMWIALPGLSMSPARGSLLASSLYRLYVLQPSRELKT
jgi:hypothetical protein